MTLPANPTRDDFQRLLNESLGIEPKRAANDLDELERRAWQRVQLAYLEGAPVAGHIIRQLEHGYLVELGRVLALVHETDMGLVQPTVVPEPTPRLFAIQECYEEDGRPRVVLSRTALEPDPWHDIHNLFPVGTRVSGVVDAVTDYGFFVELAPGISGFVHNSDAAGLAVDEVKEGLRLLVTIESIDEKRRRVSLSVNR
jgi:small subunit ribosomal protein S1